MGFLSFRKKQLSHEQKVALAYKCYNPKLVDKVFPRGKEQASVIIKSLSIILGINLSTLKATEYYRILTIYSDILARRIISKCFDDNTIMYLLSDYAEYIKTEPLAHQVHAYCAVNMIENSYALTSIEDIRNFEQAQTKHLDDELYGLTPGKPIYTIGVTSSQEYLNSLQTSKGESITWKRSHHLRVEDVKGIIDVYDVFLANGERYERIYINMYGTWTSKKTPRGFEFK